MTYLIGTYQPEMNGYRGAIPAMIHYKIKENHHRLTDPFI